MTANEIADAIERLEPVGVQTISNMLRQQQVEINKLKTKTLTDEEMLEVYKKIFNKKNEFKENLKRRSYFNFAKEILRKAQEK